MTISESVKKVIKKVYRITITTILVILGIIVLILVLVQTGPVQEYGRRKIEAYLENKLHTRVRIGQLYIGFPSRIILKNIYLEDHARDTLIAAGKIEVDISMFRLLKQEVRLNRLELDDITLKVSRQKPDSVFNYQFIADAFSSGGEKTATQKDTTGVFQYFIGPVSLHHVRFVYGDDLTGNDFWVSIGDFKTTVKTFDPSHQHYALPDISLAGVSGMIHQYKPSFILQQVIDTVQVHHVKSEPVKLELGRIDLSRIDLNYLDDAQNINAGLLIGNVHALFDSINLASLHFSLNEITVNNSDARLRLGKTAPIRAAKNSLAGQAASPAGFWYLDIAHFSVDSTSLQYDDDNQQAVRKGMDYHHLLMHHLHLNTTGIHADPSNYRILITGSSFDEQSGLVLKDLSAQLSYGSRGIQFKNLNIRTPNSEIHNQTSVTFRSLDELKKHPGDMTTNLEFDRTKIAVRDLLIFVPSLEGPLKGYAQAAFLLSGKIAGPLKDLRLTQLNLEAPGHTRITASGQIRGLPDGDKAYYDLIFSRLNTSRTDLYRFIPVKSIPDNIRIPENLSATGKFTGTINRFSLFFHLLTSSGSADVRGSLDLDQKTYDLTASTFSADLGYVLKQDSLFGRFTMEVSARGSGFNPKKMNSVFHVKLEDADIKSYHYKGLLLDATLHEGDGVIHSSMEDPNLSYRLDAETRFLDRFPSVKVKLLLDTLNTQALHLWPDSLHVHGKLNADFMSSNPDALQGQLSLADLGLTLGTHAIHTDSISLFASHGDTGQTLLFHSEAIDIDWSGKYKLTQVPESLKQFINHYYQIPVSHPDSTEPEHWQMDIRMRPSPIVLSLIPSLKGTDSLTGSLAFNSAGKDLQLKLQAEKIQFNQQIFHHIQVQTFTKDDALNYTISISDAGQKGFQIYQTSLRGKLYHNKLESTVRFEDKKRTDRYVLSGTLTQTSPGFSFVLNPDSVLLNYQHWHLPADNVIHYDSAGLLVKNLNLSNKTEAIRVNSSGETTASPLAIYFADFKIKTLTQFAEQDSLLLDGTINGQAEIRNLFGNPLFTSDLKVDNIIYDKDTVGNLVIQVNNKEQDAYGAHIALQGHDNDVQIDGRYYAGENKMDMNAKLNQLNLASFESMVHANISGLHGYLKGNLHATGSLDQPGLTGSIHFENAVIIPVITGEPLKLSEDLISFDNEGFDFNNFTLQDSSGNKAIVDGNIFTRDYKNYQFDLSLSAQNFRLVNAPKEPNRLFYGKLNLNAEADVKGDLNLPKVNARFRVNKNTNFFITLPSDDPEVVDRNGVVVFSNREKPVDSTELNLFLDSLATRARLKGMDVSATIETDTSAQFTLVVDERNGDALTFRGRAELTGSVDKSGKTSLTGNYELAKGSYDLTLSLLHRKFDIQRGSVITWTGDPRQAVLNITAIYTVNTPPIDLVQQQMVSQSASEVNRYRQKLPFQVKMYITGDLLKPNIKFDISLPDNLLATWPEVDTRLVQLRTNEAETNKQVFALLLLGYFVQENPFQSNVASTDASTIAKQSASRILSDQLNQLAGSLIGGVDINFDMNSGKDYSTGNTINQTDLVVKVSKNLFDERIRVTVGSNFQLEQTNPNQNTTNLAGDISVDYRLSKDGRYMVRVYRKDQYESILQAQVVETGVSFILTFDYNEFRELFQNKKETPAVLAPPVQKTTPSDHNPTAK